MWSESCSPQGVHVSFLAGRFTGWFDLCVLDLERAAPEEYVLGRLGAAVNATGGACSREMMCGWRREHPVLLAWCQTEKFEDELLDAGIRVEQSAFWRTERTAGA